MDWSLVLSAVGLGFAPFTVWLARKQLIQAQQAETALSIGLTCSYQGDTVENGKSRFSIFLIEIENLGLSPLRALDCTVVKKNGYTKLGDRADLFPGETLGPLYLDISKNDLEESYLHVAWLVPHRQRGYNGVRYEAVRLKFGSEVPQRWRWFPFQRPRQRLHLQLGKWIDAPHRSFDGKNLPGWPFGRSLEKVSWNDERYSSPLTPKRLR